MLALIFVALNWTSTGGKTLVVAEQTGALQGVVLDERATPIGDWVNVYRDGKKVAGTGSNEHMGGLYEIDDIRPGLYEVQISRGGGDTRSLPMRVFGVVIRPGETTTLNIATHDGTLLEESGKAPSPGTMGWLDGTILFEDGTPIGDWVDLYSNGKQVAHLGSNENMGGLFSFYNLTPGSYEVRTSRGGGDFRSRPIRMPLIIVRPGTRTILNLTTHAGDDLEIIEQPKIQYKPLQS